MMKSGLQLPSRLNKIGADIFIRHISENVNRKIDTVLKSQQFIRWFGDWQNSPETASKVVNPDGIPKVMYHQTSKDFTVFNTNNERAGKNDSKFYLHEATLIKEADLSSMTAPQLSVDTVNKSTSNDNIPYLPEIVNLDTTNSPSPSLSKKKAMQNIC